MCAAAVLVCMYAVVILAVDSVHLTCCAEMELVSAVVVTVQIPLTMDEMIDTSVEQFNELLSKHRLSDAQNQLVRDIRRRGKNKLAAQNCRKRKIEVIQTVEDEVSRRVTILAVGLLIL